MDIDLLYILLHPLDNLFIRLLLSIFQLLVIILLTQLVIRYTHFLIGNAPVLLQALLNSFPHILADAGSAGGHEKETKNCHSSRYDM